MIKKKKGNKPDKLDKIEYMDFKAISKERQKKPLPGGAYHTNPVVDKFFKFIHAKLSHQKDNYKKFSNFDPKDLI